MSKNKTKIEFRESLFWDVNIKNIDANKHKRFIIGRILQRGSFEDFLNLLDYYGEDEIKKEVVNIRYLDKKTLRFCSFYFGIPKKQFRSYNIRRNEKIQHPF